MFHCCSSRKKTYLSVKTVSQRSHFNGLRLRINLILSIRDGAFYVVIFRVQGHPEMDLFSFMPVYSAKYLFTLLFRSQTKKKEKRLIVVLFCNKKVSSWKNLSVMTNKLINLCSWKYNLDVPTRIPLAFSVHKNYKVTVIMLCVHHWIIFKLFVVHCRWLIHEETDWNYENSSRLPRHSTNLAHVYNID